MTDAIVSQRLSAIALTDISKRFGRVCALDSAQLIVHAGTVHGLLGENGAGKTTLMRIAFGMERANAGNILVDGHLVTWRSPVDAIRAGVGMVHQHFTLVPAMTVAENVELGSGIWATAGKQLGWRFDRRAAEDRVRALSAASGLVIDPRARVADLSIGAQQRVEILKALSRDARILILDEPTAVLAPLEIDDLLSWLRSYADRGGAAVLITHRLREALAVADEVTVLRRGRTVYSAPRSDVTEESLSRAMIGSDEGRETVHARVQRQVGGSAGGRPVVVLDRVRAADQERREAIDATFSMSAGEMVGLAGLDGSGYQTLLRVVAGRMQPTAGHLLRPREVAFIPGDRQRDGLILDFTLAENVALRGAADRRGVMSWPAIRERTRRLMDELDVRAESPLVRARMLSGGNQQRLVLARELDGQPALVVAENPTRGLDVRATAEVHARLRAARDGGAAVLVYSSDLDEVLALSTRVLALHAGLVKEVPLDKDRIGHAILGLA